MTSQATGPCLVRGPDGTSEAHEFHAVISAVGQLQSAKKPSDPRSRAFRRPVVPLCALGLDDQRGQACRGSVGTGASAAQFIPAVAEQAAELFVFQRTPPWITSVPPISTSRCPPARLNDPTRSGLPEMGSTVAVLARWCGAAGDGARRSRVAAAGPIGQCQE